MNHVELDWMNLGLILLHLWNGWHLSGVFVLRMSYFNSRFEIYEMLESKTFLNTSLMCWEKGCKTPTKSLNMQTFLISLQPLVKYWLKMCFYSFK